MNARRSTNGCDLRAVTEMLTRAANEKPGPILPWSLLEDLAVLIPAEEVSISELDIERRERRAQQSVLAAEYNLHLAGIGQPEDPSVEFFWQRYGTFWQGSPPTRTGWVRSWTDQYSERELRSHPFYCEVFRPKGIRYFMSLGFPAAAGHERNLLFFRGGKPDFTDTEKDLLRLLRPHLFEIHARANRQRLAALTPREWDVLELAAEGLSNADIANILFISVATVRKHMEHVFDHAGVRNRVGAIAKLMPGLPGTWT